MGDKKLAKQLRSRRLLLELSQSAMAERLGVPLRTYQDWEYAKKCPNHAGQSLIRNELSRASSPC